MTRHHLDVPARLHVEPWLDPVIDRVGHDPRSAYVETFWLGILGPSTTWLVRRLVSRLEVEPDGFDLDCLEAAQAIGIRHKLGAPSAFGRTLARSARFGITRTDGDRLAVRRRLPVLSRRLLDRLPPEIREEHARWQERDAHHSAADARDRARRLALSLMNLGEDPESTEAALHRRHLHPALASDAVRWALEQLPPPDARPHLEDVPLGTT